MARRREKNFLLRETQELGDLYGIKPQHKFGQNFLIKELVYVDIIEAADLKPEDKVLEVGPGMGFLTMMLADRVSEVHSVEIDHKIAKILPERLALFGHQNAFIHEGNVLDFPRIDGLEEFAKTKFKVVANLPYNITSVFLRKFLELENKPQSLTLMLQKEVAQRIAARPGDLSILALSVQYYADVELKFKVSRKDFWPEPEVDSAVVHIKVKDTNSLPLPAEDTKKFFRLLKIGFVAKRKMLKKNLAAALQLDPEDFARILEMAGVSPMARAQDLSLDNWLKLFALLKRDVL